MAKATIFDVVVFKNGELLNGNILNSPFTIKKSYGEIAVRKKEIANIHMRGSQFRTDQIITLDLNRFKGTLQDTIISIKLVDRQIIESPKYHSDAH